MSGETARSEEDVRMRVGLAADHGGFTLKEALRSDVFGWACSWIDYGAYEENEEDDFPDFVVPMARAVANGDVDRGVAICRSGVGACIAANKIKGVRAALVQDVYAARQGVEDDDMNVICLSGREMDKATARDLVHAFLCSRFSNEDRFRRRLEKIARLES